MVCPHTRFAVIQTHRTFYLRYTVYLVCTFRFTSHAFSRFSPLLTPFAMNFSFPLPRSWFPHGSFDGLVLSRLLRSRFSLLLSRFVLRFARIYVYYSTLTHAFSRFVHMLHAWFISSRWTHDITAFTFTFAGCRAHIRVRIFYAMVRAALRFWLRFRLRTLHVRYGCDNVTLRLPALVEHSTFPFSVTRLHSTPFTLGGPGRTTDMDGRTRYRLPVWLYIFAHTFSLSSSFRLRSFAFARWFIVWFTARLPLGSLAHHGFVRSLYTRLPHTHHVGSFCVFALDPLSSSHIFL